METIYRKLGIMALLFSCSQMATAQDSGALFLEVSRLISETKKTLKSAEDISHMSELATQLEARPNPESAGRFLETISNKEAFLQKFLIEMKNRVQNDPSQLERIKKSLLSFKEQQSSSSLPFPNFSRSWMGLGVLLAVNDYAFSKLALLKEMGGSSPMFESAMKGALIIAGTKFAISILADFLVTKRSVFVFINDFRKRRQSRKLASEMLELISAESKLRDVAWKHVGREYTIQNLGKELDRLLQLKESLSEKSPKLIDRLKRYFQTRRIEKVINKASNQLTEIEKRELLFKMKHSSAGEHFKPDAKIVAVQEQLIRDIKEWEGLHPENKINDLISESVAAEKSLKASRLLSLRPHYIATINYFFIGLALTLSSDVATVGIAEAPFENPISTLFRNHREAITFYSSMTGVLATAVHLLSYRWIKKTHNRPKEKTLRNLRGVNKQDWKLFRRSAQLAQMDLEIAKGKPEESRAINENAWNFVRTLMSQKNHLQEITSDNGGCPSAL